MTDDDRAPPSPEIRPLENDLGGAEQSSKHAAKASRAVFLSYASDDAAAALRICESLRAAGIEVWFDQSELRGGDAWDAAIRRQIKRCSLFMAVISASAHARVEGYFRLEWKLAVDRSHVGPEIPAAGSDRQYPANRRTDTRTVPRNALVERTRRRNYGCVHSARR